VREITWPEMTDPSMMPSVRGMSSSPERVGVAPRTICRYSGRAEMPPNRPMPMTTATTDVSANVRLRKNRTGISASSPIRDSVQTNAAMPTTPIT